LIRERILLDTTYLLPFFQIPLDVDHFDRLRFKQLLAQYPSIHAAAVSLYEIKAKLIRLKRNSQIPERIFSAFWRNWTILTEDPKFVIEAYCEPVDQHVNRISHEFPSLGAFDAVILAIAMNVGVLLTEDAAIHTVKTEAFFQDLQILSWREVR